MIEQTIPFDTLMHGFARCVREWILPHLTDPMARTQAELLASLLDDVPAAYTPAIRDAIRRDSDAARALLGNDAPAAREADATIDELVRENGELKRLLEVRADAARAAGDRERLAVLRRYFLASAAGDIAMAAGGDTDFASISAKDSGSKK